MMRRDLMEKNKLKIKNSSNKIIEITKKQKDDGKILFDNINDLSIDEIQKLIDDFAYPNNIINDENDTLVHRVLKRKDSLEILNILFHEKNKFKIDSINLQYSLHIACKLGDKEITSILLDNGADPNLKDENGDTPLHILSKISNEGIHHLDILQQCLDYGALLNIPNNDGLYCNQITSNKDFIKKFTQHNFDIQNNVSGILIFF
jgi:ankyrin repeat protein